MEKLGIDLFSVVVQIVNFLLLVLILKKVLYKPMLSYLKKKAEEEKLFEEKTQNIGKIEEEAKNKSEKLLTDAKKKASEIISDARREADIYLKDKMKNADRKSKTLMEDSENRVNREFEKAKIESDKKTRELAKEMAEKILKDVLGDDLQSKIVDNSISKLKKLHAVK